MNKKLLNKILNNNFFKNKKGQVSIEFIITVLFIFFIFIFSLAIFQSRVAVNNNSFFSWEASQNADRIARNINSVALMDNNSSISEYIYWRNNEFSVDFSIRTVQVNYVRGNFADSIIFTDVNNQTSVFEGLIIFEKVNDEVVIRNG